MYPYMYPAAGMIPMCCYCSMYNKTITQPAMPEESKSMFRGEVELEEDRADKGSPVPPVQQMPGMTGMPNMDMGKIKADTQEIVNMIEQHHPDMIRTLTGLGMPLGQARQYLSAVVEMSLMHHMMHQM